MINISCVYSLKLIYFCYSLQLFYYLFLAHHFRRKSQAIVIARSSSLSSSCKNFNVAHYSKSIRVINTKFGILALIMTSCCCKIRVITLKAIILQLCPLLTKILSKMMATDRRALVPHVVLLLLIYFRYLFCCL